MTKRQGRYPTNENPSETPAFTVLVLGTALALALGASPAFTSPQPAQPADLAPITGPETDHSVRFERLAARRFGDLCSQTDCNSPREIEEYLARRVYETLVEYTSASGTPVELTLRDFRRFGREQFDTIRYNEVVTIDKPPLLDIGVTEHWQADGEEPMYSEYRASIWQLTTEDLEQLETREVAELLAERRSLTIAEIFRTNKVEPRLAEAQALTSFEVEVRFGDLLHTYRAAVVELGDPSSPTTHTYTIADFVMPGAAQSILEETLPTRDEYVETRELSGPNDEADILRAAFSASGDRCLTKNESFLTSLKEGSDSTGHSGGQHEGAFQFQPTCRCENNCFAECTGDFVVEECKDVLGFLDVLTGVQHKSRKAIKEGTQTTATGLTTQLMCAGGGACAWNTCHDGMCEQTTITIGTAGATVSYTYGGDSPLWHFEAPFSHQCDVCTQCNEASCLAECDAATGVSCTNLNCEGNTGIQACLDYQCGSEEGSHCSLNLDCLCIPPIEIPEPILVPTPPGPEWSSDCRENPLACSNGDFCCNDGTCRESCITVECTSSAECPNGECCHGICVPPLQCLRF